MAKVNHGRRKGQERCTPDGGVEIQPNVNQVTILSKNDWDRIQNHLHKRAWEVEKLRKDKEDKDKLHKMCKEQVKSWPNTLTGARQRKLEARKLREDAIEAERKLIDIDEQKYEADKRKEAIEKAKTLQYYQTDRLKSFHSALLHTEVLKEREAQIELKKLKERVLEGQDNEFLELARKNYENSVLSEHSKAKETMRRAKDNADFMSAQIREHQKARNREAKDEEIEGEELKRLAAQYEIEKAHLNDIRATEERQRMSDNLKQIDDVQRMREINRMQEEEEDEECRIFAAAKRKMMKLRALKEKEMHTEQQKRLDQIRGKLQVQMQDKVNDEEDRMRKAIMEKEAQIAAEEAAKEAKMKTAYKSIAEHRANHLKELEEQKKQERLMELKILRTKEEADNVFFRNQEEKNRKKLEENKKTVEYLQEQANERMRKRLEARENEIAQEKRDVAILDVEERQFQEYAKKVIDHCEDRGRNVYPLRKAATEGIGGGLGPQFPGKGGVRPSYQTCDQMGTQLPHYKNDSTENTKLSIHGKCGTDQRLGFVWAGDK